MEALTHRQRVLTALNHQEPDRVPIDLGGSAYSLNDDIYFRLKTNMCIEGDIPAWRHGHTSNYYDERILEQLDIDFRHVWLRSRTDKKLPVYEDGSYIDEWGVTWRPQSGFVAIITHPLENADLSDLRSYPWPKANAPGRTEGLKERARELHETTDYSVVARAPTSIGLIDFCCNLRGIEQFMVDMLVNKPFATEMLNHISQFMLELVELYLDAAGDNIDIFCWGEDFGHQSGMLISPDLYREFFKTRHAEIVSLVKRKAPQARFQFHCCGAIRPIIEDFIDIGVDILQAIQPLAKGMESEGLKRDFGDRLIFHGGVDIQRALIGTLDDIDREVRKRIMALAPDGGYILAPTNNIQDDTPEENIYHMYEVAKVYGRYPIQLDHELTAF